MQANMFKIKISSPSSSTGVVSVIGRRIVPGEIPAKPSLELWRDFIVSVKREIDFYQLIKNLKANQDLDPRVVKDLFPKVYYDSGKDVGDRVHSLRVSLVINQ